mgnify:CR=1 FL=1
MKKTFKAIISVLLVAVIVVACFTACSNNANNSEKSEKVYKVGICQLTQHEALDAATKGFRDALTEKLGDKVVFDEQNASGESTNCTTIVSKFVSDKVDLILANATPALTAATEATNTIPIVGTSITDYATALAISDWNGKTGINVTGTADLAPLKDQAAMIKELVPNAKTVGILYCSAEPNSKYQSDIVKSELEALGYEVKVFTFVDSNDVLAVTQSAFSERPGLFRTARRFTSRQITQRLQTQNLSILLQSRQRFRLSQAKKAFAKAAVSQLFQSATMTSATRQVLWLTKYL